MVMDVSLSVHLHKASYICRVMPTTHNSPWYIEDVLQALHTGKGNQWLTALPFAYGLSLRETEYQNCMVTCYLVLESLDAVCPGLNIWFAEILRSLGMTHIRTKSRK